MSEAIDMDRGVSAPLDYLAAAQDPRVVAVVLARDCLPTVTGAETFAFWLKERDIAVTPDEALAILEAVAAWDALDCITPCPIDHSERRRLDAAVTAIAGERP